MTIHAHMNDQQALARARQETLRAAWAGRRSLRVVGLLSPSVCVMLRDTLREVEHPLVLSPTDRYRQHSYRPGAAEVPRLERFGRWLQQGFVDWVAGWTGEALASAPSGRVSATLLTRGSRLGLRSDADGQRALAFIIGLTPSPWPAAEGGHLELCRRTARGEVELIERRPPGWGTLDLFDVSDPEVLYRVPALTEDREARAVVGWLHRPR